MREAVRPDNVGDHGRTLAMIYGLGSWPTHPDPSVVDASAAA
jgi:hypothetical protein